MKDILKNTKTAIFIIGLAILTWLISFAYLPDSIPMQYSVNGSVNWSANKYVASLIIIAVMIFCYLTFIFSTKKNQKRKKYSHIVNLDHFFSSLTQGFLYIISLIIIFNALGQNISVNYIIPLVLAVIIIIVGNYLPKLPQNKSLGIKNKWTLKSEKTWKQTHRFTSRIYIIAGLIYLLFGVFGKINSFITIPLVIILVIVPYIFSYINYSTAK